MLRGTPTQVWDLLIPLALLASLTAGGWLFGREADERAVQNFDNHIEIVAERVATQIEFHVEAQLELLSFAAEESLTLKYSPFGNGAGSEITAAAITLMNFMARAKAIVERRPGIQAINWVSNEGTIEITAPSDSNQAALSKNLNEHPDPNVRRAFQAAVQPFSGHGGEFSRTSLIELYQGGLGFAVYHPVLDDKGTQLGVLNASFRLADLVNSCVDEETLEGNNQFEIVDGSGNSVFATFEIGPGEDWSHSSVTELEIVLGELFVHLRPTPQWLGANLSRDVTWITLIGVLLGLLSAGLSWSVARRRRGQLESEWRLRLALEGASLGVWEFSVGSGVLHLNREWRQMLGLDEGEREIALPEYRRLIHPDDLGKVEECMVQHLAGKSAIYRTEHRVQSKSGGWIWVLDVGSVVERDLAGRPLRVAGTQHDVTDTRHAELELKRTTARYRAIFEHSPIGLLEQDMSGAKLLLDRLRDEGVEDLREYFDEAPDRIDQFEGLTKTLDKNLAFLSLFSASSMEQYRENAKYMLESRAKRSYEEELIALFSGALSCEVDFPLRSMEGKQLLYTARLTVAPGCMEDFSSVFVSLVDNTRLIQEEEERTRVEVRQREVQKSESLALLAGGVAHDFNNLLVPIIGNLELVMDKLPKDSESLANLLRAEQAAQRAAELARQMQIYSGRGQVQSEAFDVNALVKEMSSLLVSSLPGKVRMSPAMHVGELAMEGDPTQLRQLVMNLVLNAADAIGDVSGVVSVTTGTVVVLAEDLEGAFTGPDFSPGEHIFLEVGDSGKGLEESTRRRMFEPFFSTKSTGRGLGMSVVLGIVRGHGGALIVESELGVGTRIRAMLPTTTKAISHKRRFGAGPRKSAEVDPSGALVLLADDEASVLRFARAALLSMNLTVVTAENGLTAVEEYKSLLEAGTIPDLVVLDATMPVMGGIEAMDNIRLLGHDVPIVLSSGYTLEGVATRAAETAQCWFLPKPYGMTELTSLVMRVLSEGSQTPGA